MWQRRSMRVSSFTPCEPTSGNTSERARHPNVLFIAFINAVWNQVYYFGGPDIQPLGTRCVTILVLLVSVPSTAESFGVWEPVVLPVLPLLIRICIRYRNCGKNQEKFSLLNVFCLNLRTACYCSFSHMSEAFLMLDDDLWSHKTIQHKLVQAP